MISRRAPSWQLILADLALILFLVTLSALARESPQGRDNLATRPSNLDAEDTPQIASSQALFRPLAQGPSLKQWLSEQPADPRATLTIFARHVGADSDGAKMWDQAQTLASSAEGSGFAVRVVITQGEQNDLYASLAYDAPSADTPRL
ncbi:hypothetical protein [Qipengyuania sp. ASV99]|uniref:hypothetical protein n=1 Tax=Qipengyuania sp. ASV99 TaxID=3399681 RepID=UPI003A4C6211